MEVKEAELDEKVEDGFNYREWFRRQLIIDPNLVGQIAENLVSYLADEVGGKDNVSRRMLELAVDHNPIGFIEE